MNPLMGSAVSAAPEDMVGEQPAGELADQQELLSQLIAESLEYIHGKARNEVVKELSTTGNMSETMAAITYKVTRGLIDKHKKQGMAIDVDMDFALGLATEVIDELLEVAHRLDPDVDVNVDRLREDTLLRTVMLHAEQYGDDPEAQEQAKVMLRQMMQSGQTDQAFDYVNRRAGAEGLNVNDMIRVGNQFLAQRGAGATPENPVAMAAGQQVQPPAETVGPPEGVPPEEPPLMGGM